MGRDNGGKGGKYRGGCVGVVVVDEEILGRK